MQALSALGLRSFSLCWRAWRKRASAWHEAGQVFGWCLGVSGLGLRFRVLVFIAREAQMQPTEGAVRSTKLTCSTAGGKHP